MSMCCCGKRNKYYNDVFTIVLICYLEINIYIYMLCMIDSMFGCQNSTLIRHRITSLLALHKKIFDVKIEYPLPIEND